MKFAITEVSPTDQATLAMTMPHPWPALGASVSPRMSAVARGFKVAAYYAGVAPLADEILTAFGNGLIEPFSAFRFKPVVQVSNYQQRLKIVNAVDGLSLEFKGLMSAVAWNALTCLGVDGYPGEPARVVQATDARFDGPGWATNAVLGAYFKTPDLKTHAERCLALEAGAVPAYDPLDDSGRWQMLGPVSKGPRPNLVEAQKERMGLAFFANFLTEALSIAHFKMPFVMRQAMVMG